MNVIHITPSMSETGYEIVELLANRYSRTNSMAVIKNKNGEILFTCGYILENTPIITNILDTISPSEQYNFIQTFKTEPFVQSYYEEPVPPITNNISIDIPTYTDLERMRIINESDFPFGIGMIKMLRILLWDISFNKDNNRKINQFCYHLSNGMTPKHAYNMVNAMI